MAHRAFESFAESLSGRRATRRGALAASVAGALGIVGGAGAAAQDATPEAIQDAAHPMFLFLQLAESGTWMPSAEDPEIFLLTLAGIGSQTAFFSDRPERIVGTVDTAAFLENLGFTPVNPPNAAAVVRTPEGERDVLVVELFDPVYTREFGEAGGGSLTYKARVLDAYHGDNLTSWYDEQDNPELPSVFDQVSLFIDDCPDLIYCCYLPGQWPDGCPIGSGVHVGTCWNSDTWYCDVCDPNRDYGALCNQTFASCNNQCEAHYAGDACFC
jgi:hypothetical protein